MATWVAGDEEGDGDGGRSGGTVPECAAMTEEGGGWCVIVLKIGNSRGVRNSVSAQTGMCKSGFRTCTKGEETLLSGPRMYEKIHNYIIMGVRKFESRVFSPACGQCLKGEGDFDHVDSDQNNNNKY
jgi:hypothetical protein